MREIVGTEFRVVFEILDNRMHRLKANAPSEEYVVTISLASQTVLAGAVYAAPGVYSLDVPSPDSFKDRAKIQVQVQVKSGTISRDSFWISINTGFYRILKWVLLLPFFLMVGLFSFSRVQPSGRLSL